MSEDRVHYGTLGLGTANLGNLYREMSDETAHAILETAWDAGVRYYDTAPHYGLGLSERRLGTFLRTKPRSEFVVSTKVGRLIRPSGRPATELDLENDFAVPADRMRVWDFSEEGIRTSLQESLQRLGLDRVDTLFLHDPERHDLALGLSSALPALARLRSEGAVREIGVGAMTIDALLGAARSGLADVLMVAGRYTLADQSGMAAVREASRAAGVRFVNASVFNSGLLATNEPRPDARFEYGAVPAEVFERVQAIAARARAHGVELPAAALQFSLRDELVASVVVGASSADQMRQNAERMRATIPAELWDELAELGLLPT